VAVAALCGLCASVHAQRNAIDVKIRLEGQTQWVDTLVVDPTITPVAYVQVAVFYERMSGLGFAGSTHNVVVSNWNPSLGHEITLLDRADSQQHPDGRQGRFNFGGQRQATYLSGADAGTARIAASNNTQNVTAGGISVRQNTPIASGSLFDTSNPAMGFRFDMTLPAPWHGFGTWNIGTPANRIMNFGIYETEGSTSATNVALSSVVLDGAVISFFLPAPGTVMAFLLGAAVRGRQTRRP
jgi:hypothetical protein